MSSRTCDVALRQRLAEPRGRPLRPRVAKLRIEPAPSQHPHSTARTATARACSVLRLQGWSVHTTTTIAVAPCSHGAAPWCLWLAG